ncbi:MAG: Zn-ribbon domain-containing OB-fold protein [Ignavibacteria bacterium]|nr:Zn-ribbon domain-containing OB-fold protein [Ignavibacteria bacterium]MBT8390605.1 Zn-ribbon domain-containing OB-fold protein [Ignavibacteria bacterium]NNL20937.1 Zn-ribbon domain-containing OB-fold protein [Ignavibacteriaceae bacterium]
MISPRYHREIPQRYRLEAGKCKGCGYVSFPPRLVCPECGKNDFDLFKLDNEGKLLTYTIIRVGSDKFVGKTPFAVGIVELKDGVKLTTQIADVNLDELKIGQQVKLVFRKIQDEGKSGLHCYGYKAILI